MMNKEIVSIIMGSTSDKRIMAYARDLLIKFHIPYEYLIISAHRTPNRLFQYATNAEKNGIRVIIAGAGGAAHLPGMVASLTSLPVLGVPIDSKTLKGIDSLLSIVQMPAGVPVASLAIGRSGAINAALMAIRILSLNNKKLSEELSSWIKCQTELVPEIP